MDCKNAYIKNGINYILCSREPEPKPGDQRAICHAICGFQRFCPTIRSCTLLPSYVGCMKLKAENTPETHDAPAGTKIPEAETVNAPKKKTAKKAVKTAEEG